MAISGVINGLKEMNGPDTQTIVNDSLGELTRQKMDSSL